MTIKRHTGVSLWCMELSILRLGEEIGKKISSSPKRKKRLEWEFLKGLNEKMAKVKLWIYIKTLVAHSYIPSEVSS